jgi:cysteinyl-tRNA synthetase
MLDIGGMEIRLYNTLSRTKEKFRPLRKGRVGLYTCGPTVYNYAHIGNLRTYIFEDVLRRALVAAGYRVRHIMNITDVGHLTSDADTGEDKLEKGALAEGKSVWDVARFYTDAFLSDIAQLNIRRADKLVPATGAIADQIALIKKLFAGGYAYETPQAVYFDVSRFRDYTRLSGQRLEDKKTAARGDVVEDSDKRNAADFALWFRCVGKFANHVMRWPSPWGEGFPGWHIECSAISARYLGQPFDIHTGGVDHIPVHHTNEIAQSEAATGKPLARMWMHGEFLLIRDEKMAKSAGNFMTLSTLTDKGADPLAFRYLTLGSHYRSRLNFSRESLAAAGYSLERLRDFIRALATPPTRATGARARASSLAAWKKRFDAAIADDLNTPQALAVVWDLIGACHKAPPHFSPAAVRRLLLDFDSVLGLGLKDIKKEGIPGEISALARRRERYRAAHDWDASDKMREEIKSAGYDLEDTPSGPVLKKSR